MKLAKFVSTLAALMINTALASELPNSLPNSFDSLGPTVKQLTTETGRQIHYVDDGVTKAHPVVFTGGLGTSVRAIRLLDFLSTMRQNLNIRMITVERNGFGQTQFNPDLDMADYAKDVEYVLDHLDIDHFSLFGISGGGPYTAKIASRLHKRVLSIHMAATSPLIGQADWCSPDRGTSGYSDLLAYPMQFFGFPKSSSMHQVEGFQDTAFEEAARAHNLRGQSADPAPLEHEMALYCSEGAIDTSHVKTKLFVYRGQADELLTNEPNDAWQKHYPKATIFLRNYPGEGHDVQYRHLDQILLDLSGQNSQILICKDGDQKMISPVAQQKLSPREYKLGLCQWDS